MSPRGGSVLLCRQRRRFDELISGCCGFPAPGQQRRVFLLLSFPVLLLFLSPDLPAWRDIKGCCWRLCSAGSGTFLLFSLVTAMLNEGVVVVGQDKVSVVPFFCLLSVNRQDRPNSLSSPSVGFRIHTLCFLLLSCAFLRDLFDFVLMSLTFSDSV